MIITIIKKGNLDGSNYANITLKNARLEYNYSNTIQLMRTDELVFSNEIIHLKPPITL